MFRYKVCNLNVLSEIFIPVFHVQNDFIKYEIKITLENNLPDKDFKDF